MLSTRSAHRLGPIAFFAALLPALTLSTALGGPEVDLLDPQSDEPGLKVGQAAPKLTLENSEGEKVNLGDLYKNGPVVVNFYRGGWCPFCNRALKDWRDDLDDLRGLGATFVAISPETKEHAIETREKVGAEYETLVDRDGKALRAFRLGFKDQRHASMLEDWNASGRAELPAPGTFIVDRQGVIRWRFVDWDYTKRADPNDVIDYVRTMNASSRDADSE